MMGGLTELIPLVDGLANLTIDLETGQLNLTTGI
jgi:hypothetical protein